MASPSSASQTIPIRLLLISDTHSFSPPDPSSPSTKHLLHPLPQSPSISVLIHAGDLTMTGTLAENLTTYSLLSTHPAELKLVIPGNHDTTLDPAYYASIGSQRFHKSNPQDLTAIRELWTGPQARERGIVYMEEGVQTFTLTTGAHFTVYASAWTPEFERWAFAYERNVDRYNPPLSTPNFSLRNLIGKTGKAPENPVPAFPAVDIMVTHGPPHGLLDKVPPRRVAATATAAANNNNGGPGQEGQGTSVGCEHLMKAVRRARPRLHVFGHIHEGWGATRLQWKNNSDEKGDQEKEVQVEDGRTDRGKREAVELDTRDLEFGRETLFVNASMLDAGYKGVNRAWVVEIEVPKKQSLSR